MKVDLHCHTDNTVQGDINRLVDPKKFKDIVEDHDIKIVAITNHNKFIKERYDELKEVTEGITLIWPGIELTVDCGNGERHLIIIASPRYIEEFNNIISTLLGETNPNDVCVPLEDLRNIFNPSKVVYIVHYHDKAKKFFDSEVDKLKSILSNDDLVFLEPTNITSMGIFLDHDMRSIIGSDVIDWDNYPIEKLPDLRLPVEDFETFRLLANKDKRVVKKILSTEENFKVKVGKHWNRDFIFYKDINIIFGGKGTGKTILANEINSYLSINKDKVKYFNSEQSNVNYKDSVEVTFTGDEYKKFTSNDMSIDIKYIKDWVQSSPTKIQNYIEWAEKKSITEITDKFTFINMTFDDIIDDSEYLEFLESMNSLLDVEESYSVIDLTSKVTEKNKQTFEESLLNLKNELLEGLNDKFIDLYSLKLLSRTLQIMKALVLEKKQVVSKPLSIGFSEYYSDRVTIIEKIEKLSDLFHKENKFEKSKLGEVEHKGEIYLRKEIIINPKGITQITYKDGMGKQKITQIIDGIETSLSSSFDLDFGEKHSNLKQILLDNNVTNINMLIGRKNITTLQDLSTPYDPSKGEKHMLALNNVILEDYNYFILDEPTVGLGHEYVSNNILPQLKKLVKQGKTYIIVTHDANIGVRSLPFQSIYMQYNNDEKEFYVYEGNPFENILYEVNDKNKTLKWNSIAQSVLEGGEIAFIERRKIYGE